MAGLVILLIQVFQVIAALQDGLVIQASPANPALAVLQAGPVIPAYLVLAVLQAGPVIPAYLVLVVYQASAA